MRKNRKKLFFAVFPQNMYFCKKTAMDFPILIADVIDSRKQDSKNLIRNLKEIVSIINGKNYDVLRSPLTITLGDEFQGITKTISDGINIIFQFEEQLIKRGLEFKLKYVLNYGTIDTEINSKIAYEMLGEGLTFARENLNELKTDDARFLILLGEKSERLQTLVNDSFLLYQSFVDSWRPKDYNIVWEFLNEIDYRKVAEYVKIDPSNAWRRRKSLNIKEYQTVKKLILTLLEA